MVSGDASLHKRRIQQLELEIQQQVSFTYRIPLAYRWSVTDISFCHIVRLHELAQMVTGRAPHPLEVRKYGLLDLQEPRSHMPRPGGFQTGSWTQASEVENECDGVCAGCCGLV